MQILVQNNSLTEARDPYMLQYFLKQPNMLSTTGYKVLQGQKEAGFIPCYRVVYDTLDKLDYDIEQYRDIQSLLAGLTSDCFLQYVKKTLAIVVNMKHIGFLHPYNIETQLDKIFVDLADNSIHMVYLPIEESFLSPFGDQYVQVLKQELAAAIQNYPNLQMEFTNWYYGLLMDGTEQLEHLYEALAGVAITPVTEAVAGAGTTSLNQTGAIGMTSGSLSDPVLDQSAAPVVEPEESQSVEQAKKPKVKKGLFGTKKPVQVEEQDDFGGTEVLSVFVPNIFLKGQGKAEYLVNKHEYILGRDSSADGTIDSTAISRQHCKIIHSDSRNFIMDLGSANGTYLNGTKLEPNKHRPINEGDKLKLGNVSFTVMNV